jgi:hypothetical protein
VDTDEDAMADQGYLSVGESVDVEPGAARRQDLIAQRFTACLSGRVIDSTGAPVPGMSVEASDWSGHYASRETDVSGQFNLGVTAGQWRLHVSSGDAGERGLLAPEIEIQLADGQCRSNLTLVMLRATTQITGTLRTDAGAPVPYQRIYVEGVVRGTNYESGIDTDGTGAFSLGVTPGPWQVNVACYSLAEACLSCPDSRSVTIPGPNPPLHFVVSPLGVLANPLPPAALGEPYWASLEATGGSPNGLWWSLAPGSPPLPPGLTLTPQGELYGTPLAEGGWPFTVRVQSSLTCFADAELAITVGNFAGTDVLLYGINKEQEYLQTSVNPPALAGPLPFRFDAFAYLNPGGSVNSMSLRLPNGQTRFLLPPALQSIESFASLAELNAAYPDGVYLFTINAAHDGTLMAALPLAGSLYPNAPRVANYAAAQAIDPAASFSLQWDPMTGGTPNDFIRVQVFDAQFHLVFETAPTPGPGALDGTATAVTIPPHTLAAGRTYYAMLLFWKGVFFNMTDYPGAAGVCGFVKYTRFLLQTAGGAPPRLSPLQVVGNVLLLELTGTPGRTYLLEESSDLRAWDRVPGEWLLSGDSAIIPLPLEPQPPQRFFRAKQK